MPDDKEAPVYTAERILQERKRKGKTEYLIKWKGWTTKYNTWEPEKHILDKLLIADFRNRNSKRPRSQSAKTQSLNKRAKTSQTRSNNSTRTRYIPSSSSSDNSRTPVSSPSNDDDDGNEKYNDDEDNNNKEENDDDENDEQFETSSKMKNDSDRKIGYKLRTNRRTKSDDEIKDIEPLSKESVVEKPQEDTAEENFSISNEKTKFDESIRKFLWTQNEDYQTSNDTTTLTEVTDQTNITVTIRELKCINSSSTTTTTNTTRLPRVLGYGSAGRGGKH